MDADIYGPSLPKMMAINQKPESDGKSLTPIEKFGLQTISIGYLVDEETPMIWRGPMVTSAIKTFTQKVVWKDLDFLIVDMPPGTGTRSSLSLKKSKLTAPSSSQRLKKLPSSTSKEELKCSTN